MNHIRLYLDHAATTPLSTSAREAMLPWLDCGNPSSLYEEGRKAKDAIDASRESLSQALGCLFAEVVFTSSGTEAANLAVLGLAAANLDPRRNRVLIGAAEHHCVLHAEPLLQRLGYRVEMLPVDRYGRVQTDALETNIGSDVLLVSVMHANNELGSINDAARISEITHRQGAAFHCDAVQSFLSLGSRTVGDLGADLVSVSAHKVNGPKGCGALYVRAGTRIKPLAVGGGQERELRAGTENVAAIAGFGAAVAEHRAGVPDGRLAARQAFWETLVKDGLARTVPEEIPTLPGHLHLRYPGIGAETLLIVLDRLGVSASSGAACSAGSVEPSHVLLACGYRLEEAREGLRFTFGKSTTEEEAVEAARRLNRAVAQVRSKRA
ncbi:MAG TPA: cysteine desulfurase family protein [Fimbriimonas sp.]